MKPWGVMRRFGQVAATGDPYWSNVVSLLHFDGADGSTTFTDQRGKSWTAVGNAQIDTALGYNAGLFDGAGDYISTPDHADFNFGSGDWTCDAWVYRPPAPANTNAVFGQWSAGSDSQLLLYISVSSAIGFALSTSGSYQAGNDIASGAGVVPVGSLTHLEWCRDGTTFRIYVDGAQKLTHTLAGSLYNSSSNFTIGGNSQGAYDSNISVRQARITKGVCRHPGGTTFTPPTAPFPNS